MCSFASEMRHIFMSFGDTHGMLPFQKAGVSRRGVPPPVTSQSSPMAMRLGALGIKHLLQLPNKLKDPFLLVADRADEPQRRQTLVVRGPIRIPHRKIPALLFELP